ncbi:hypothetical protein R50072_14530 [Simiduia litorea]|uniref:SOS response-associated peptidase family protein n=1 Tax=Simiduia litorea TaxID=1435348 RepID=UPI0036F37C37
MCGYIRRHVDPRTLNDFLALLGAEGRYEGADDDTPKIQHYYPAFGGDPTRTIDGLLIKKGGALKQVDATWWYDCRDVGGELEVGPRTTFNARNLTSLYWRDAIRHRRAIVIATGLGEGKKVAGKNTHYLVTTQRLMLLGAVYQEFPGEKYSCAIITRDTHPRFEPYHDKAFPLFLPYNLAFLTLWLSDAGDEHPQIAQLLSNPRIFTELKITPVKTFKGELATGPTEYLRAD